MGIIGAVSGHSFDFQKLHRDTFMPAMIASYSGDRGPLRFELQKLLL
jgi:cell filamentation protein